MIDYVARHISTEDLMEYNTALRDHTDMSRGFRYVAIGSRYVIRALPLAASVAGAFIMGEEPLGGAGVVGASILVAILDGANVASNLAFSRELGDIVDSSHRTTS